MKYYWPLTLSISYLLVIANMFLIYHIGMRSATIMMYFIFALSLLIAIPKYGFSPVKRCIALYALVAVNDVGYRLFSSGYHHFIYQAKLNIFFIACAILVFVPLFIFTLVWRNGTWAQKITSLLLFPALVAAHLLVFFKLGLDRDVNIV